MPTMHRMNTFTVYYNQTNHLSVPGQVVFEHNLESRTGIPGGPEGKQLVELFPMNDEGKECHITAFDGDTVTVERTPNLPGPAAYRVQVQAVHSINE